MSRLAFMTLLNRENTKLSPHFGKAKWVMIRDTDTGAAQFVQNAGLNGQAVVAILAANGCSDVVFTEIGPGALAHLQTANIRGWFAPANIPVAEIAEMFARGTLKRATAPSESHGRYGCGKSGATHA
jgi:predicted Fe-Mo cluster-binding NifX family protein